MNEKKKLERRRWLNQKDGNLPRPKSVDRGFISLMGPATIGGTDEQASHDDLTRTASLEQDPGGHRIGQDTIREDSMRSACLSGFLDEIQKTAVDKPTFLEKGEEIVRTVGRHGVRGMKSKEGAGKAWGAVKGGYRGLKKSFKKHPGMFIGPAAAYAGWELLKSIKGKDEDRR